MSVVTPCRLCLNNDKGGQDLFNCNEDGRSYAQFVKDIFRIEVGHTLFTSSKFGVSLKLPTPCR